MPGLPKVCSSVSVRSNRYGYLYLGLGGRHAGRDMMGARRGEPPLVVVRSVRRARACGAKGCLPGHATTAARPPCTSQPAPLLRLS